jgi:threonine dehydrogenase-like Zn-dependent dehydrogenase
MKTKGVRLYGENDLRLDEFELPQIKDNEILAKVVSDSLCMSSYKAASQGTNHKRVPANIAEKPIIIGHEFCGEIVEVGSKWAGEFKTGQTFTVQPALNYEGAPVGLLSAPGYSYEFIGGNSQYIIIPNEVMDKKCLLTFEGDSFYQGSLAEPMSCIVGGFNATYHTTPGSYIHEMGVREGGALAMLAGVGPMGLGAIDYILHCDRQPSMLVVTDIDAERLERAASLFTVEHAKECGVELIYVNTSEEGKDTNYLKSLSPEGKGFDDVLVMVPIRPVIEQGGELLGFDGCLNFFAGPTDQHYMAEFNFYNVHYAAAHVVGVSGGNGDDMRESLELIEQDRINPSLMITHIGGLDAVVETTLNLPKIPGSKKLIYNHISMPLTALEDFAEKGKSDPLFAKLAEIVEEANGLWCPAAEKYLLANAQAI